MRQFMRFVFPAADRLGINAGTIQLTDTPFSTTSAAGAPYPQSLQVEFTATSPAPPHVIPLFPGELTFIPDPAATGTTPAPNDVAVANYPNWKTRGALMVRLVDTDVMKEFLTVMTPVGPIPTTLWYGPIVITQDFLFVTLATGLKKNEVVSGNTKIQPSNANWRKHAIAGFLRGRYKPELRIDKTSAAKDDVEQFPMPEVVVGSNSRVQLTVTVARTQKPQDADDKVFDANSGSVPTTDPAHHRHGAIPARHVYRTLRPELLDGGPDPVVDAVLAVWPNGPRYFPLRFTRTWKQVPNASIHLPKVSAKIVEATGGTVLAEQRLPAHGVFFLSQQPAVPPPAEPRVEVSLVGDVRWLDGATPNVWRRKGASSPVTFPLTSVLPHIVVRRRMRDEIFADKSRPAPGGMRCTYMSLRRTLRALVDNRIAGGRLVNERMSTTAVTKQLIDDAFAGTPASSAIIINGQPKPSANPATTSPKLGKIWEAFFPDPAAAQLVGGSNTPRDPYTLGQVAYYLWQVGKEQALDNTKRNFSDAHVGRGSAGALVAAGLATDFTVDPPPKPVRPVGLSDAQYFEKIVDLMISGVVEPGSLLQFWVLNSDFERLKNRGVTSPADIQKYGHSPTFVELMPIDPATGKPGGIVVIDQFGETSCPIVGTAADRRIEWSEPIEIWCAASWDE